MSDITPGSIIRIKPGISYRGYDISNKLAIVLTTDSYIVAEVPGINEDVKLLRYEIAQVELDLLKSLDQIPLI